MTTDPDVAGPTLPRDARTLAAGVSSGLWSAREVVDDFLARVDRDNDRINALVAVRAEGARADADEVDRAPLGRRHEVDGSDPAAPAATGAQDGRQGEYRRD